MVNRIGLDHLTMTGVAPVQFIKTAAAAGARNVALWPQMNKLNPYALPHYSLVEDKALRRDTLACLGDNGVAVELIDALVIQPDHYVEEMRPTIEACVEIGARRFNAVSFDPSLDRTTDGMAALAAIGAEYGCTIVIEFCPLLPIASLALSMNILKQVAAPNLKLLVDTMHVVRSGEVELLSRIDPNLIDYIQISDGPLSAESMESYGREATLERGVPGEGVMPLAEIVALVPPHVIVSGEVPMHARRIAGMSDLDRSRLVVAGIERVLDQVQKLI